MNYFRSCLLATISLTLLASCGPGSEDSTKAKDIEDASRNRQVMSQFVGNYDGEVEPISPNEDSYRKRRRADYPNDPKFFSRMVPVKMSIWIENVPNGVDSNGRSIFRPELRGFYERQDYPDVILWTRRPLNISYLEETNTLSMRNSDIRTGPNPNLGTVSITGRYSGNDLTGDISYDATTNGILRVKRAP